MNRQLIKLSMLTLVSLAIVKCVGRFIKCNLAKKLEADREALQPWWDEINNNRAKDCLAYNQVGDSILPQHAVVKSKWIVRKVGRDVRINLQCKLKLTNYVGGTML